MYPDEESPATIGDLLQALHGPVFLGFPTIIWNRQHMFRFFPIG